MLSPDEDIHWMQLALEQASKGVGTTSPNPPVGAVIVKGGKLIGKGWHQKAGGPHAEREAIADCVKQHQPKHLMAHDLCDTGAVLQPRPNSHHAQTEF